MRSSTVTIVSIAVLGAAPSISMAGPPTESEIARRFDVRWSSVQYHKNVVVHNPAVSSNGQKTSETVQLQCEAEIRNPDLILGTSSDCTVTELIDGSGRAVKIDAPPQGGPRRGLRDRYEGLNYDTRFARPKVSRWREAIRSFLNLPRRGSQQPQRVTELKPSRFQVRLDADLIEQDKAEIGRLKGYFHALVVESYVNVDLPFEPNDNWMQLTPDVSVRVAEARCDGHSYRLRTEAHPRGLDLLFADGPLPDQVVVDRQLLGSDGKPIEPRHRMGHIPAPVNGSSSGSRSGGDLDIQTIRFVIAVKPRHQKIPFELEHIALPDPDAPQP